MGAAEPHRNKTLGVVGYGDIGQKCAHIARAFGMRIVAMRRRTELSEDERDSGLKARRAHAATGGLVVAESLLGGLLVAHTLRLCFPSLVCLRRVRAHGCWYFCPSLARVHQRWPDVKELHCACRMHASQPAASTARALLGRDARMRCAVPLWRLVDARSVLCGHTACDCVGAARCSRLTS